jgi:hypothetical protein
MSLKKKTRTIIQGLEERANYSSIFKQTFSIVNRIKTNGFEILYLAALFLFSGGIVNGMLEGSNPLLQSFLIYPQRGIQTVSETLIYFFIMGTGSVGIYLIYIGGRQSLRQRISDFYVIMGFSSVILALSFSLYLFDVKV